MTDAARTPAVYETGPLKGLPRRAGRSPAAVNAFALEAIRRTPIHVSESDVVRIVVGGDARPGAVTYMGDPALTDEAIDQILDLQPEPHGFTGSVVAVVIIACTVAWFGLKILGLV